ncbi:MAG: hypothetical protein Q4D87_09000 [Actinomycetaceae bacterium]|nr:hypothetical protein [Actinomycetaceae bacterium]
MDEAGRGRSNWANILAAFEYGPASSAYHHATDPEAAQWTLQVELLAQIREGLDVVRWMLAGGKNGNRPKPIPRPGDKKRYGQGESWTVESLDEWIRLKEQEV